MSKKEYNAVANILKTEKGLPEEEAIRGAIARRLADLFARDNHLFSRSRFLAACEVPEGNNSSAIAEQYAASESSVTGFSVDEERERA